MKRQPKRLRKADIENFNQLKQAFENDQACLMHCQDAATGEYRAVICAVHKELGGLVNGKIVHEAIVMTPFAAMCWDDPYKLWQSPNPEGGFFPVEEAQP